MLADAEARDIQTAHERIRPVDQATHNKIDTFIWSKADDVLRDPEVARQAPDPALRRHRLLGVGR